MEFSRADVERVLETVSLTDSQARATLNPQILEGLEARVAAHRSRELPFALDRDPERDISLIIRSTLLTYAVMAELEAGNFEVETPYFLRPIGPGFERLIAYDGAVGMVQTLRSRRPEFGVSVKLPRWLFNEPFIDLPFYPERASTVRLPRFDLRLPLSVSVGIDIPHRAPSPAHATSACYAVWGDVTGVIVAGHSVRNCVYGDYVPLDTGDIGRFVGSGYRPIDAAFLDVADPPHSLSDLPVVAYPAMGDEVVVQTRDGDEYRVVAQVNNSMVSPYFSEYPIVLYLDRACQSGDSGSLVRLVTTGEAVGIYTGEHDPIEPRAEGPLGTAQNFAQAIYTLGVQPKH